MPRFELHIPKSDAIPVDLLLALTGDNWIDALKRGLAKLGDSVAEIENVLCDIKPDNSIQVTDMVSGASFTIVELADTTRSSKTTPAFHDPSGSGGTPLNRTAPTQPSMPQVRTPQTSEKETSTDPTPSETSTIDLEKLFEQSQKVHLLPHHQAALDFMLDLAMQVVPCDAGSVFLADINTQDLVIQSARGPKADLLQAIRIRIGQGFVGFCAEVGVGINIRDATHDSRFYSQVSESIGYPTRSVLCAPMQLEGRVFGVLELINRKQAIPFSSQEMHAANFIANQLAQFLVRQES